MTFINEELSEPIGEMFFIEGTFLVAYKSGHLGDTYFINKLVCIFPTPEDIIVLYIITYFKLTTDLIYLLAETRVATRLRYE